MIHVIPSSRVIMHEFCGVQLGGLSGWTQSKTGGFYEAHA